MNIKLDTGARVKVPQAEWTHGEYEVVKEPPEHDAPQMQEKLRIERKETGSIKQFPVTLAWALTAHKAQGSTFDSIVIGPDTGFFAFGQFYVALSRCRTLEGVRIHGRLKESHVAAHPGVLKYEYA